MDREARGDGDERGGSGCDLIVGDLSDLEVMKVMMSWYNVLVTLKEEPQLKNQLGFNGWD